MTTDIPPLFFLLPDKATGVATENAAAGTGIGDGYGFSALAAYEGAVYLFRRDLFLMSPIHALAVGGAEFPPMVVPVGDEDEAAAAGAGEGSQDGSLPRLMDWTARLFPIRKAAARFGAEALGLPVSGERPAAAVAGSGYLHGAMFPAAKWTRKKGRVKSSLRSFSVKWIS